MDYEIRPLTQGFGAEIFGLDLASGFSDNLAQDLVGAWVDAGGLIGKDCITTHWRDGFGMKQ